MLNFKTTKSGEGNDYYQLAQSWDTDIIRKAVVSRNRAYVFAGLCLTTAAAACFAVAALSPLKRVEVATVLWDQNTGVVRHVRYTDDLARFTGDEAVIKNHIQQFMVARETWEMNTDTEYRRRIVKLFIAPSLLNQYSEEFNPSVSNSRANIFGTRIKRRVTVRSISFLNKRTALVQWTSQDEQAGETGPLVTWSSVVGFNFTAPPSNEDDVHLNPLGFQVTSYRRDQIVADPVK